jgi:hypothetical protein
MLLPDNATDIPPIVSYHSIIIGWEKDKRQGGIGHIEKISSSGKKYLQREFCWAIVDFAASAQTTVQRNKR